MSGEPTEQELKLAMRRANDIFTEALSHRTIAIREAIIKAQNRYGGLRPAARALKISTAYLQRLKSGEKTNPSDEVLKKLRLL